VFGDFDGSSRTISAFFGGEIDRVATTASHPANVTLYDLVPSVPTCEDIFVTTGSSFEIRFTGDSNVIGPRRRHLPLADRSGRAVPSGARGMLQDDTVTLTRVGQAPVSLV
jgi:hypothetical protein